MSELIFTYGTLMKGQSAFNRYPDMNYISDAVLLNYGLYEANDGNYPCAVPIKGFKVYGEIYSVKSDIIQKMDEYEEEGDLYIRKKVQVFADENKSYNVWFYEYAHSTNDLKLRIPDGKWSENKKPADSCSWYVCYGSNLLRERFVYYLKASKGYIYAEKVLILNGRLYFAKKSRRWDNKAVAFVDFDDTDHKVYCYAYLLDNEQIDLISELEGKTWYPKQYLGKDEYDIDMFMVNGSHVDTGEACHDYLQIIAGGLKDCFNLSDDEIKEYLHTNDDFIYERGYIKEILRKHCETI